MEKNTQPKIPPPKPPPADVLVAEDPWHPMSTAPKDGSYVLLKGDVHDEANEFVNEWFWYKTRQFRKGMWQPVGWWRRRFGPNVQPSFTPEGWRSAREGMPK